MKNILNLTFLAAALLLLLNGCREDSEIRFPELEKGANVRVVIDPNASFLNFEDLPNAEFNYDIYSENQNLETVELYVYYVPNDPSLASRKLLLETLTQADFNAGNGQVSRSYSAQDFVDLFDLGSLDALEGGDFFNFRNVTTLTNGRVFSDSTFVSNAPGFNGNSPTTVATDMITASATTHFTSVYSTFVGCPSVIPTGTFIQSFSGFLAPESVIAWDNPEADGLEHEVTITRTGPVSYQVSQVDQPAEYYYGSIGYSGFSNTGLIQDICGTLQGSYNTQFVAAAFNPIIDPANSSFDNDAQTLTIAFTTGFGGEGTYAYFKP
jgi:hypothetical protein